MTSPNSANSALWSAASEGDLSTVRRALDAGAEIEGKDVMGRTPLMEAARFGHSSVVRELLRRGADPEAKTLIGQTAGTLASDNYEVSVLLDEAIREKKARGGNLSGLFSANMYRNDSTSPGQDIGSNHSTSPANNIHTPAGLSTSFTSMNGTSAHTSPFANGNGTSSNGTNSGSTSPFAMANNGNNATPFAMGNGGNATPFGNVSNATPFGNGGNATPFGNVSGAPSGNGNVQTSSAFASAFSGGISPFANGGASPFANTGGPAFGNGNGTAGLPPNGASPFASSAAINLMRAASASGVGPNYLGGGGGGGGPNAHMSTFSSAKSIGNPYSISAAGNGVGSHTNNFIRAHSVSAYGNGNGAVHMHGQMSTHVSGQMSTHMSGQMSTHMSGQMSLSPPGGGGTAGGGGLFGQPGGMSSSRAMSGSLGLGGGPHQGPGGLAQNLLRSSSTPFAMEGGAGSLGGPGLGNFGQMTKASTMLPPGSGGGLINMLNGLQQSPSPFGLAPRGMSDGRPVCMYWSSGRCRFGARCRFSHPADSAPQPRAAASPQMPVCRHWQAGRCHYGTACRFRHEADSLAGLSLSDPPAPPTPALGLASLANGLRARGGEGGSSGYGLDFDELADRPDSAGYGFASEEQLLAAGAGVASSKPWEEDNWDVLSAALRGED